MLLLIGVLLAYTSHRGTPTAPQGAVVSLVPYGALAEYGTPDGTSLCAHAVGVATQDGPGGTVGPDWQDAVVTANAVATELAGEPHTTGLVGQAGPDKGVVVQEGAQRAQLPLGPGEVVLQRNGALELVILPEQLTTGSLTRVPMQADWFAGPLQGGSAGLALALSAYDAFTVGNLCHHGPVAATGLLRNDGSVHPVEAVAEKSVLAEQAGMSMFIVPEGQGEQARSGLPNTTTMTVHEVSNVTEAITTVGGVLTR